MLILIHRYGESSPSWEFPKGFGVEASTPEACARRELKEETGLTCGSMEPLFVAGQEFKEHVFLAKVANLSAARSDSMEETENISGFKKVPIAGDGPVDYAAHGVNDALTIATLAHLQIQFACGLL